MSVLYLDCSRGAAGDMLTGALMELLPDADAFEERFNQIGIPKVRMVREDTVKCGIAGKHVRMLVDGVEEDEEMHEHPAHQEDHEHTHHGHPHHHASMGQIEEIIRALAVDETVKQDVCAVYRSIAEAESHAHGHPVTDVHFHEVGRMDAIADVTAVCMLMREIAPDRVMASPIHVGGGTVRCAHGVLPVPAPATAYLLQGIPMYGSLEDGELCTPTGAALLKYFVQSFGDMPVLAAERIGYGMGKKDFAVANYLRAFLGTEDGSTGEVTELSCNVDDMTPEEIAFACEELMSHGAWDVYTVNIGMKKGRPGILLKVACAPEKKGEMAALIFRHTSTIGIRENQMHRYILDRRMEEVRSPFGPIRKKVSGGYGTARAKLEYEDLARIAREQNMSLREVRESVVRSDGKN